MTNSNCCTFLLVILFLTQPTPTPNDLPRPPATIHPTPRLDNNNNSTTLISTSASGQADSSVACALTVPTVCLPSTHSARILCYPAQTGGLPY